MILIRLMGGLGNQMFQYAFGRRMSLIHNTELVLDQSLLIDKSQPHELVTHRDFSLEVFNIQHIYRWATEDEIFNYNGNPNASITKKIKRRFINLVKPKQLIIQKYNEFNKGVLFIKDDACFVGRWQSELYFNDVSEQIRQDFKINSTFSTHVEDVVSLIKNCNAVCLHVRRGDLITSALYSSSIGALTLDYYTKAINAIRAKVENPTFFIFSDDIEWCKKNIHLKEQTYYMDNSTAGLNSEGHLYLMQCCQHFIISNSTYAWWGAWLVENKTNKLFILSNGIRMLNLITHICLQIIG